MAVEDTTQGLASARAARLRTIAVTTTFPPEVVAGADAVVATLREVTSPLLASLVGGDAVQAAGNRTVLGVDPVSPRNLLVQIRRRDHPAVEVAEVELLVRRVRVLVRQADAEEH